MDAIDQLAGEHRLILRAKLEPVAGSSFQPTGFPDLGAAEFERPAANGNGKTRSLLVESVQSMANRLEDVGWSAVDHSPVDTLAAFPYIEVNDPEGRHLTSSRTEPHRLAGAYLAQATHDGTGESGVDWMKGRFDIAEGAPIEWKDLYARIFEIDPLTLLHGVFLSSKPWRSHGNPKVRRAITGVIEAHGVNPVVSGGVKRDDVNPTTDEGRQAGEGFGFIPYGRTEYTAEEIILSFVVDVEQIRGYGLGMERAALLLSIALWEIQSLLSRPLRLRTACDLELASEVEIVRPQDYALPSIDALAGAIASPGVKFDADLVPTALTFSGK